MPSSSRWFLSASERGNAATEIDRALRDAVPDVTEVFLDPTPADEAR